MDKEEMTAKMMEFLDAKTAAEKIRIFEDMREADEHILANIAVSLDVIIDDKADNYERIMSELKLRKRFEVDADRLSGLR